MAVHVCKYMYVHSSLLSRECFRIGVKSPVTLIGVLNTVFETYVNQLTLLCRIDAIVYTLRFDVAFMMEKKVEMVHNEKGNNI